LCSKPGPTVSPECGGTEKSGSCGDGNALDPNELQSVFRRTLDFQTQLDGFANALGDLVERPRLRVACGNLWNGGNVEALLVALNDDIELA
jgi:hypothetical protein